MLQGKLDICKPEFLAALCAAAGNKLASFNAQATSNLVRLRVSACTQSAQLGFSLHCEYHSKLMYPCQALASGACSFAVGVQACTWMSSNAVSPAQQQAGMTLADLVAGLGFGYTEPPGH